VKKTLGVVAFLLAGAGAVAVAALSNNTMLGSDALKATPGLLSLCGGGINYTGGGSVLGEKALIASTSQTVAPMSRFLESAACSAADPSKAEGIAFAADGLSIVVSRVHRTACDPTSSAPPAASCTSSGPSGLKSSGTLVPSTYVLGANSAVTQVTGWRDVLRLMFLGLPNTAGKDPDGTTVAGRALRDCGSAARQALVNNWGNLFENGCTGSGGSCTQLNHVFRPDSFSGAADVLRELIDAKLFPFCNQRFAGDTTPVEYPTTLSSGAPIFEEEYQDFDPIRRTCVGGGSGDGGSLPQPIDNSDGTQTQPDFPPFPAEQVCSPKGALGLVLPIRPPVFNGETVADAYPTKPCVKGTLAFGAAPVLPGTTSSTLCPNGDVTLGQSATDYNPATGVIANSSHSCLIPVAADGDPRCINGRNNFVSPLDPPLGVIPASLRDGRVYNLHVRTQAGSYRSDLQVGSARNIVGDFSRIHATRTLIAAAPICPGVGSDGRCCEQLTATEQIRCLTQADPCSFGLTAGTGSAFQLQTSGPAPESDFAASINDIQNEQPCVVGGSYPLSRKMYLNTMIGFENVTGEERDFAACLAGLGNNALVSPLLQLGLFPLPTGPVCQDFPQETCPGGAPASDACANNLADGFPFLPPVNKCAGLSADDGNSCTSDTCDPPTGAINHFSNPGAVCVAASCATGTQKSAGQCSSTGACVPGTTSSCGAYACEDSACRSSCTGDNQCAVGAFCLEGFECEPQAGPGGPCMVNNACASGACLASGCCDPAAPDPLASVAISGLGATDFVTQVAPLYSGVSAAQQATPGAIDANHVAVVRGKVLTESGSPQSCAKISVVGSPNLGSVGTRADGSYTIAVNGGGPVTIRAELAGSLSSDRQVDTKWHAYAIAQDIHLLPFGAATHVLTDSSGATIAQTLASGATETDAQGSRTARLLVPAGTTATVEGETTPRLDFDIQIKEMTNMSKSGRDGMVASLPAASAFTYAVNLSLAGAEGQTVNLSQAVPVYVDNFLGMPNGETVPVGYYDTNAAQWVASENGRVIKIVGKDLTTGQAQLDIETPATEAATAQDMVALGITTTELLQLATTYPIGTSLWRFRTHHFSNWDCNWGWGPPPTATPPSNPPPLPPRLPTCDGGGPSIQTGSIIECEPQVLREEVPLAGTPFKLAYSSARHPDGAAPLRIPVVGNSLPVGLIGIQLEIYVAGNKFTPAIQIPAASALPYFYDFYWDGTDASGRKLYGSQTVDVRIGYIYDGSYESTPQFGYNGDGVPITASQGRFEATLWQYWTGTLDRWDAAEKGLGGWELDVQHGYDPLTGAVHLGSGRDEVIPSSINVLTTIAGTGVAGEGADNVLGSTSAIAINGASVNSNVAVAANGDVYFSDTVNNRIRKVASNGIITTINSVASANGVGFGDEGPVVDATFDKPTALAFGPDGRLYVCDSNRSRVRVIDTQGTIHAFAGSGIAGMGAIGGLATTTAINTPTGVSVAPDGTVFIADSLNNLVRRVRDGFMTTAASGFNYVSSIAAGKDGSVYFTDYHNNRVERIGVDGVVTTFAGGGTAVGYLPFGDGGPAANAVLNQPDGVAVAPDGTLYIADKADNMIRHVKADGTIETVAGTGVNGSGLDGLAAAKTALNLPRGLGVGPDGSLYIADTNNQRIRKTVTAVTNIAWPGGLVSSTDGHELYDFDAHGTHIKTLDGRTGILKWAFRYDSAGYLTGVSDRDLSDPTRHETQIQRDVQEVATAIVAPTGQSTSLDIVGSQLLSITDMDGGQYAFDYYPSGGLLHHFSDPLVTANSAVPYAFTFLNGRLTADSDPYAKSQSLGLGNIPTVSSGWRVTHTSQTQIVSTYDTQFPDVNTIQRTNTGPDQLQTLITARFDGKPVYAAPGSTAPTYSAYSATPDGSSTYTLTNPDSVLGMQAPIVSSQVEVMGATGPTRTTTRTRTITRSDPNDPSSVLSYTEGQTVNGRALPDMLSYSATTHTFTTTSPAGRSTSRVIDTFGRTHSFQIGTLTPTVFTYDDSGTATGKVSNADRNDGTIDLATATPTMAQVTEGCPAT
jgi:NHL repeat